MPASRPQKPDNHAKTTTAASNPSNTSTTESTQSLDSSKEQHQKSQAIVSSPLNSPTNSHVHRFSARLSPSSLDPSSLTPVLKTSHVTDIASNSLHPAENLAAPILPSSASVSSSASTHSLSGAANVILPGNHAQHAQSSQHQDQVQVNHSPSQSQMIALTQARLFAQQLQQQQQHHKNVNQTADHRDASRRISWISASSRSVVGSMMSGQGNAAVSTIGGASPLLGGGQGRFNNDEPAEQTLLLVRPVWVQDQDAAACHICARTFNAVRRKHHCRQCGRVLCHDCSARSIALPQLGYTKAVRVCNDCFEVAYLVAYCVSDDLGQSTQIHGARGLYDLIRTNDAKALESVLDYGGLDAVIYLCSLVHGYELHALATSSLAVLAEHQTIQGLILSKRAMSKLFHLVMAYAQHTTLPVRSPSPPMPLTRMPSTASLHTKGVRRIETIAVVLMNITHITFQMVPDKMFARQIAQEGAVDSLMCLCVYFPPGVRTRATEEALRSMSTAQNESKSDDQDSSSRPSSEDNPSEGSNPAHGIEGEDNDDEETSQVSMDDMFHIQLENMQGLAAKCLSVLAADVSNQAFIVDDPDRIDRLVQLLYSNNLGVVKYACKTMAYLSLRSDRYKPDIVKGAGAAALLAVIRTGSEGHAQTNGTTLSEAVSHACCALANLATNTESQEILMSHLDLLNITCAVVGLFPHQREIERHVARLFANLALYDQNKLSLLTAYNSASEKTLHEPSPTPKPAHYEHPKAIPHRYSSPPPPPRRAKGNVIPTLLYIGSLTLERANDTEDQEREQDYSHQEQDIIDFMNDDSQTTAPDYVTPNGSASANDVSGRDSSLDEQVILEWVTIRGMEDIQRHIIRAIDNLMTSVLEDPSSNQSFKVFSRIWPTIGLIKTIQMANQDEDTQRRASHVLSILIQQQQIHTDTTSALEPQNLSSTEQRSQVDAHHSLPRLSLGQMLEGQTGAVVPQQEEPVQEEPQHTSDYTNSQDELSLRNKDAETEALAELGQQDDKSHGKESLEKERHKQERIEEERLEEERLEEERLEEERLEEERLEEERLEEERLEEECLEEERLETECSLGERFKQARLRHERREQLSTEGLKGYQMANFYQKDAEEAAVESTLSKIMPSSEDHSTSQDEEQPRPKEQEKAKKKKKKKSAK
ncbi:hypothetical protein BG011_003060 [Mortierella polycephala]|uniref:FYVE-type domain-containing protein n=1 Tax=Mortierella polycephala TaxID=41804 RepID=A0A9P6U3E8_9FUNG|nr:hypothetical protein BG011_003060 [Mortierella polycephala]